ncbi:hypothetical protein PCANB_002841 [Pneumocystis canis]|nr:hypothetical protein PCANB_002841 [Pneumocystis canis]
MNKNRNFHHPFTPYPIQNEFMEALYSAIERGGVGIFNSPTGTGKSLSIICGALTWLREHDFFYLEHENNDEPEWIIKYEIEEKKRSIEKKKKKTEEKLEKIRKDEEINKYIEVNKKFSFKKQRLNPHDESDDESFLINDYDSDDDNCKKFSYLNSIDANNFSPQVLQLLHKLKYPIEGEDNSEDDDKYPEELKIIYSSRTHSQLTQFINELRRVSFPSIFCENDTQPIKHIALASRKNLCINPKVSKLSNINSINEKCLELQKNGTVSENKCKYLPKNDKTKIHKFRDYALANIRDIEDLVILGKKLEICPYYSSRAALKSAEVITLPYPLLLQASTRKTLNLSLKNHIVIIDEAHNLIDAITSIYSSTITFNQVSLAINQIDLYLSKFNKKLKGKNQVYIKQIMKLLQNISDFMKQKSSIVGDIQVEQSEILFSKGADQINIYKLEKYIKSSGLARKIDGYFEKISKNSNKKIKNNENNTISGLPVLSHIQTFLLSLTNPFTEGKIFFGHIEDSETNNKTNTNCYLKYLLLNPCHQFKEIVNEARAVILAGGTMEPMDDIIYQLFPYLQKEKIHKFSCGHIISPDHLCAIIISSGPSKEEFMFNYEKRNNDVMLNELGNTLINLCRVIPDGLICFFPSYEYLEKVVQKWNIKQQESKSSIWERLEKKKKIFMEERLSENTENILQNYSYAINSSSTSTCNGALLLSVVGGKLSEGINFSDKLGRGIVIVGLPFPNIQSAEWKAKLEFIENNSRQHFLNNPNIQKDSIEYLVKSAKEEYYENICMRSFESKSSRVKGVSFHPKRPWILTSLHNGTIQLCRDYRIGTLIDRFDEHDGPVRGISFHNTQPLFVSGGDDYKIRVWNYKSRKLFFTLNGHLDYVRTVFFHHEYPWILSCSDDQTVRIWNWQSRNSIAILTGHNHYVMCAQFHPKEDLVVSASLDQTIRVWDISELHKKNTTPSLAFENQLGKSHTQTSDLFGNNGVVVKYLLEGHDRGINWVSFHPTLPLIISAGDDRLIKLWRMSETKAWEVDTCRGHFNNASAVLFHPHQDLILSVGEDKSIRIWDLNKRTSLHSFRRDNDRFWIIAAHPEINLFAAGHDNGVMIFKLERERPTYTVYQDTLFFVNKENYICSFDLKNDISESFVISLKKLSSRWKKPRTISYNPSQEMILACSPTDNGIYEIFHLTSDEEKSLRNSETKKNTSFTPENEDSEELCGSATSAIFITRNKFAVFEKSDQTIKIKDLLNATIKTIQLNITINNIFPAGNKHIIISSPMSVILYDIQQKNIVNQLSISQVKYIVWSNDGEHVALLGKHTLTIATKLLKQVCSLHETVRIKSACWDDSNILLYSTLNHIKYTLLNGDNGIIRTINQLIYLVRVKGKTVYSLDRNSKLKFINIDPTEYHFKLALINKNYEEVLHTIRTSNLVGQNIIKYVQEKGYPEIALQFVQDPQTRFELSLKCSNLELALNVARKIDKPEIWNSLATEALLQGNHQITEISYQKLKNFNKLSMLYFITGNINKIEKMLKIAETRGDYTGRFYNSLFLGDIESHALAYATAKTYGFTDHCNSILKETGIKEDDIKIPSGEILLPPKPLYKTFETNWPLKPVTQTWIEKAFFHKFDLMTIEDQYTHYNDINAMTNVDDTISTMEHNQKDITSENTDEGWDIDDDIIINTETPSEEDFGIEANISSGIKETDLWVRNSPLAADHIAAGSFESAMQLLHRQVAIVNFEPLKSKFMLIFQASRVFLPASPSLPSLQYYLRRTKETDSRKLLPNIPLNLNAISKHLQNGYQLVRANKLQEAVDIFRDILYNLLLVIIAQLVEISQQYIVGLSMELKRRETPTESIKRNLELAAYFTHIMLQPSHKQLALRQAMNLSYKNKNLFSASHFAVQLLELNPSGQVLEQAQKILAIGDKTPKDAIEINYDPFTEFDICSKSYTPIYKGDSKELCPFCGAKYLLEYRKTLCVICKISNIGGSASGQRNRIFIK